MPTTYSFVNHTLWVPKWFIHTVHSGKNTVRQLRFDKDGHSSKDGSNF